MIRRILERLDRWWNAWGWWVLICVLVGWAAAISGCRAAHDPAEWIVVDRSEHRDWREELREHRIWIDF